MPSFQDWALSTRGIVSPRLGAVLKLSADGRTALRASYGRFSQGVLTGELELFHPGAMPVTTRAFDDATGDYSRLVSVVEPTVNLVLDRRTRAPRTDEYSAGVDREIGRHLAVAAAYVHKNGRHFIGWTDVGGQYIAASQPLSDGRSVPVFRLTSSAMSRRFLLTNEERYFLRYHGLVIALEKRRSHGWQAFGSYTRSNRRLGRIEVLVDVLNALNDPAEEALATDNLFGPTFGRGVAFVDPRRAMVGIRLHLGT